MNEKQVVRGALLGLTLGMLALGYNVTRARADGIPATRPLTYSGTLEENGTPATGMRNLRLTIYDDAMSSSSMNTRCITNAPNTPVNNGRFQVVLDPACVAAVRSTPDLWLEIEVSGAAIGRTKLSAVPFAVESGRANELTPAAANALVPTGTVVAFAGRPDRVPAGWMLCDGRSLTREMYPALFNAIGTAHGGDGTNFNLPDYRGRFLRGVDGGAGRDPNRSARASANNGGNVGDLVGSVQDDAIQGHRHPDSGHAHDSRWIGTGGSGPLGWGGITGTLGGLQTGTSRAEIGGPIEFGYGIPRVAIETRPVNAAVHYIIKI